MSERTEDDNNFVDWVSERARCSLFEVFRQLRKGVEDDIAARMKLPRPNGIVFRIRGDDPPDPRRFGVLCFGDQNDALDFACTDTGIEVRDASGRVIIRATLTLNDKCECRLRVGGRELENWQFRRRALEEFFRF